MSFEHLATRTILNAKIREGPLGIFYGGGSIAVIPRASHMSGDIQGVVHDLVWL